MDEWDDSLFPECEPESPHPSSSSWLYRHFGTFRHFTKTISEVSVCTVQVFMDGKDTDGFLGDLTGYMKQYNAKKIQEYKKQEKTPQYKNKPKKTRKHKNKSKKTHRKRQAMKALPAPKLEASEGENYPSGSQEVYEEKEASEEQAIPEESFRRESKLEFEELLQEKIDSEHSSDGENKTECQGLAEDKEREESQQNKWNSEKCCVELESSGGEMFIGKKRKGDVLDGNKRKRLETATK